MIRIVFILFFLLAGNPLFAQETSPNIIFMIGDGTGLSQITAGMYANGNKTALEDFEVIGLSKTHSANNLVTDSAASGTAMACGVKTFFSKNRSNNFTIVHIHLATITFNKKFFAVTVLLFR